MAMREIYLKFNVEERYDVKIETIEEMNKSIFLDSYIQAYKELNIISSEKNTNGIDKNNIIAFLGERGSGKTSCMRSFLGSLKYLNKNRFDVEDDELKKSLEDLCKVNFEILNIVEPSFFSEKVNVIELIVSSMFKKFSIEIEQNNKDYEIKRTLLKSFQEIFKNMKYMKCSEEYQSSEIEELMALGTSVNFKMHLYELIDQYLKFFSKNKLIISIDDIDLNTKFAYCMAEDVRKYLSIPNVVIVLALKLEQLKAIIAKEYSEEYEKLLNFSTYKDNIVSDIENRVEKYLLKLIPYERRIYLKNPDSYDENIKIFINGEQIGSQSEKFQDTILNFIFQKTDMLFLKPEYGMSRIIPTNLRELVGLVTILESMNDPLLVKNVEVAKNKNYKSFKNYLYSYIFKNKISQKEQNIIKTLLLTSYNKKNSYIVSEIGIEEEDIFSFDSSLVKKKSSNIIDVVKSIIDIEDNISYFPFYLKTIYSNLLYESFKEGKNNFYYLIGKGNYINAEKYTLLHFNEKIKRVISENANLQVLELFLLNNNREKNENQGKELSFSLIAPFENIMSKLGKRGFPLQMQNFIFRNMEIYEQFYLFLENIKIDNQVTNIHSAWRKVKKFYSSEVGKFIKTFPDPLKGKLEKDLLDFLVKIKNVPNTELEGLEYLIIRTNATSNDD